MIEETHWHPVALCDEVAEAPVAITLLERALVLWRDDVGTLHAWADQCPHRGAKLSIGRVVAGRLECAYHGWQFEPGGRCAHVPALPTLVQSPSHCARTHQACEAYGLIWVQWAGFAPPGPKFPEPPVFAAESDPRLRKLNCGPYDVATSAPRIVENFLDMAHFGFVHEGWLGAREAVAIDDYQVQTTPHGLLATQCKAWQPRATVQSTVPAQVEYTYEVNAPYTAILTKLPEVKKASDKALHMAPDATSLRESIALFICPTGPETSRVWFRLAVTDFESADEKLREFQHTIFMQDKPVLESQTPKRLPLDLRAEAHTAADKASSAYRRHLKTLGITFGVC